MCLVGPTLGAVGSMGMDTSFIWKEGVFSGFLEVTMLKVNSDKTGYTKGRQIGKKVGESTQS